MRLSGKKGFTLAEVLVALTVAGIVTTLTIPVLMQKMQEIQFRTTYKETYSVLDQVTTKIMQNNGGTLKGVIGSTNEDFLNAYLYYLNSSKRCDFPDGRGNCWGNKFYRLNGVEEVFFGYFKPDATSSNSWTDVLAVMLNNGVSLVFINKDSNCTLDTGLEGCGAIFIDVNNVKGPNTVGKDIYGVYVLINGIKPFGYKPIHDGLKYCVLPPNSGWNDPFNAGYACGLYYLQGGGPSAYYQP